MAVRFRDVSCPPLKRLTVSAPAGALIGLIGLDGSGLRELLRLAEGVTAPAAGVVEAPASRRLIGVADELDLSPVDLLLLDNALAGRDALTRARAAMSLLLLQRQGTTILLVSHEEPLLRSLADEIWWLEGGRLAAKGDPGEVLEQYRRFVAERVRAAGQGRVLPLPPSLRRGDGRAELVSIETLDEQGRPTAAWRSGEQVSVRVRVRYREAVENPVVGIMIRTSIGMEVYGTNTELEKAGFGPCAAGETIAVLFSFQCDLCPREYTLTAASHDPDGALHEWLEDAVAFQVVDARFTAGVAKLRASVSVER
jgi:ABC-type methionine transport system ATPase subunit